MNGSVLIIDDDTAFRFAMAKALRRSGYAVSEASSGEEAVDVLSNGLPPDVALLDLKMKGIGGLEVLRRCGSISTRVIVLTGHGTVKAAVEAMQLGAFSFLEKPVDANMLRPLLRQALVEKGRAEPGGALDDATPLIGESPAMDEVKDFIRTVAPTDETVLVFGETGTGKEVVARQIHAQSNRAQRPFVAMNAACVPRELFESELFGHRRGAFTGAHDDRAGLFREADGGTLFIDELAELPLESQAKLLRAIETKQIRPVGESGEILGRRPYRGSDQSRPVDRDPGWEVSRRLVLSTSGFSRAGSPSARAPRRPRTAGEAPARPPRQEQSHTRLGLARQRFESMTGPATFESSSTCCDAHRSSRFPTHSTATWSAG